MKAPDCKCLRCARLGFSYHKLTPDNLYTSRPCESIYRGTYHNHNHDPKRSKHLETHAAKLYARSCSNTTTRAQHCLGLSHFLAKKTRSSPLPRMKRPSGQPNAQVGRGTACCSLRGHLVIYVSISEDLWAFAQPARSGRGSAKNAVILN